VPPLLLFPLGRFCEGMSHAHRALGGCASAVCARERAEVVMMVHAFVPCWHLWPPRECSSGVMSPKRVCWSERPERRRRGLPCELVMNIAKELEGRAGERWHVRSSDVCSPLGGACDV